MSNDLTLKLVLKADGSGLSGSLRDASGEIRDFGNTADREAGRASGAIGKTGKSVNAVTGQFGALEKQVGMAVKGLAAFFIAQAGFDQAQQLVQTVASYQDMTTKLEGLSTSAIAFAENEQYLIDLSKEHHKDLLTLGDGYSRILALEEAQIVNREQGREILEGLSNASSKLGASNAQLEQSLYGLAQGLSAGTLRAEELNQITEPLPGLLQALDKASGQAAGGFRQMVNDGEVTSKMFRDTLIVAFEEYEGAATATADNLTAKYTDIQNRYTLLARALEAPVTAALNPLLDSTVETLETLTEHASNFSDALDSGQAAAYLDAMSAKFDAWGRDIDITLRTIEELFDITTEQLKAKVGSTVGFMIVAFKNFPENVRAFIRLMTVEVLVGFDKAVAYAQSFKDSIAAVFTDDTLDDVNARLEQRLGIINKVRLSSITGILEERDTELAAYQTRIDAADELRKSYDELKESKKGTEDPLKQNNTSGSGNDNDLGKPDKKLLDWYAKFTKVVDPAKAAQAQYNQTLDNLKKLLGEGSAEYELMAGHAKNLFDEATQSPYEKLNKELEDQLSLVGLSARELEIETNLRKLNADAADEEKEAISRLTGQLFDLNEARDLNDEIAGFEVSVDSIGDAWTRTGDAASEAIANMSKTYMDFADQWTNASKDQDKIDEYRLQNQQNLTDGLITQSEFKQNESKLAEQQGELEKKNGENQIALYHGLAGAMSSAFAKGSAEAEAFKTVQQGLALYDGIRAVVNAWAAPWPVNLGMVPLTIANVASLLGQMGQSFSGGSASMPSMSQEQIGFETTQTDNDSVTSRLDQQIELLEAIEQNGSAAALNVDLAAAEYQSALYEWVEAVFDKSRLGFVDAMFDANSEHWASIEAHYKSLDIANPYEMEGDQIRIRVEQFYQDPESLITVIQDIAQMSSGDGYNYSGPFGQALADEYGYGEGADEAFKAAMRSTFVELQGHLNDWAVTSIESLTDLSDASESMKESFDAITGSTRYATEELDEAYAVFDRISGGDYAGYLEENIDAIARAEGWLEQLTNSYDENGNQLTNFELLLSKNVDLFQDQAAAAGVFSEMLGDTFEGGTEEALNFISSIDLVAESLQKTRELEDQILELTDSEEYLIVMRQRELDALTDTQKALQKQVWALEDQAEAQAALLSITDLISDSLSPLSATEKTLVDANRAMVALGMTGLTYTDALISIEDYDTDDLINLADALGMSFKDIQTLIKDIIDGNEHISGGAGSSGVQSVEAAQTALSVAESDIWQFADVINESFGGVIPTVKEFNAAFGDLGTDKLVEIEGKYGGLVDSLFGGIENLPGSKNALEDAYFDQFDSLNEDQLIDQIDKDIGEIYKRLFGRLPDLEGLEHWRDEVEAPDGWSLGQLETELKTHPEYQGYNDFNGLLGLFDEYQTDQAAAGFDVGAMADSLAVLDTAKGTLQTALASVPAEVAETLNNAGEDFNAGIQQQLDGFGLEGEDLELFDLEIWKEGLIDQAEAAGGDVELVEELYGKKRVEIVDKYAQEAADALQKAFDFDKGIQQQIDSFGLEGEALELFDLEIWKENLIDQAEAAGGDLVKVEELYGLKRAEIAKQYAQEAADEQVEDAGLNAYLQSVSDYVDDQSQFIKDSYADQIAVVEQWRDIAKDLSHYVDQIKLSELSPAGPAEKLQQAQESFAALLVAAEGGDIEAAGKLTGAADTYLNLADGYYGRSDAYTSEFDYVVDSLDKLGVDWAAENNDDAIKHLNEQMKGELEDLAQYARDELEYARKQAVALTGIDTALGAWPDKFDTMLDDLATDIGTTVTNAIPTAPDRPVVNAGGGSTTGNAGQSSGGDSGSDVVDTGTTGMSAADATAIIQASGGQSGTDSASYQAAVAALGITSYSQIADIIDGSHADGLDSVPFDGYRAELHQNEMVLTADVADHIRQSMRVSVNSQSTSDPALIRLIESLVASNQRLEAEVAALRSERSGADKAANDKRDEAIKATKKSGRQPQEVI